MPSAAQKADLFAPLPRLKPRDFERVRELAAREFGLDLKPGKEELVSARLGKRLREGGFGSFDDYFEHVRRDRTGESLVALIDALTTNYTSFLREPSHFDCLRDQVLPALGARREISLWCAAAATGEEPYTLAFVLLEALRGPARPAVRILATDISTRALGQAAQGIYSEQRLAGLPQKWRGQYFQREAGGGWRVRPEVRRLIEFRRLNLIDRYRLGRRFPVIFCRNVMIYFNTETRRQVVGRLIEHLEPGGYLFVGHSESLAGRDHPLHYVKPAVYQKEMTGRAGGGKGAAG